MKLQILLLIFFTITYQAQETIKCVEQISKIRSFSSSNPLESYSPYPKTKSYIQSSLTALTLLTHQECSKDNTIIPISTKCSKHLRESLKIISACTKSFNPILITMNIYLFQHLYQNGLKKECPLFKDVDFVTMDKQTTTSCFKAIISFPKQINTEDLEGAAEFIQGVTNSIKLLNGCGQKYIAQKLDEFIGGKCFKAVAETISAINVLNGKSDKISTEDQIVSLIPLRSKTISQCL